jgi:hypothetical protein
VNEPSGRRARVALTGGRKGVTATPVGTPWRRESLNAAPEPGPWAGSVSVRVFDLDPGELSVTPGIDDGLLVAIRGNYLDSARGTGVAPLVGTAGRAPEGT